MNFRVHSKMDIANILYIQDIGFKFYCEKKKEEPASLSLPYN